MNRKTSRFLDNLVFKYDFLYPLKKKPFFIMNIFFFYFLICCFIVYQIFLVDGGIDGIIKNILPFFVDLFIVILFTSIIFIYKMTSNDEIGRIEEKYVQVIQIFDIIIPSENIKINFNANDYYQMPPFLEDVLKWLNINKDEYFRISAGSVDIPKLSLKNITLDNENLTFNLGITSYYNIFFTHYFADYLLSYEDSMETVKDTHTLRRYLTPILKNHYGQLKNSQSINFHYLLPNPLGMTGIICIESQDSYFFILKIRENLDAAAKKKLQWSFAGTMDIFPKLFNNFSFEDIINDELYDEVLNYSEFHFLKELQAKYSLLGIIVNELYLFQPEMFVCVHYKVEGNQIFPFETPIKFIPSLQNKKFILIKEKKDNNMETIKKLIQTNHIDGYPFKTRNLFEPGFNLFEKYIKKQKNNVI